MLRNQIKDWLEREIGTDDLTEVVSKILKKAVEKNDTTLLDQFFGVDAYQSYLTDSDIEQSNAKLEGKREPNEEEWYKYLNTQYLRLGLYYASKQGSLKVAKYFLTNQHLPGDLQVNVASYQKFLEPDKELKGPPLNLAVESGNLDLVKYIYENSEATVETSIGQPIEPTPLMKACESTNEAMVEYLLEKGANPNSEKFASFNSVTPLTIAIDSRNDAIIRLLVMNGAIVSSEEVNVALIKNLDLNTIEFLMQHSINHEDPYHPYIISAIKSGNIALVKAMENNDFVKPVDEIALFSEMNIEKRLLLAAAASGELQMMKYFVEEKNLDLVRFLSEEYDYFEKHQGEESLRKMHKSTETILYYAACNNDRKNVVPLLQYLFFEQVTTSNAVIKKLCSKGLYEIQTIAFLHSLLSYDSVEKSQLEKIAFEFDKLNLVDLFKIYNCPFIHNGNFYDNHHHDFMKIIEERIQEKATGVKPQQLLALIENDKEAATGALFYFCTNQFDRHSEMFCYLLTQLTVYSGLFPTVDVKNCEGDTLAKFASHQRSYHIVQHLLARGANPDEPNLKGETLLNPIVDFSYLRDRELPWIKTYLNEDPLAFALQNSLRYETKRGLGGNEGIEALLKLTGGMIGDLKLAELINNCCEGHNKNWKIESFLSNLSPKYASEMGRLVKHEGLKGNVSESQLNAYFSRVDGFDFNQLMKSNYTQGSPVMFSSKPKEKEDSMVCKTLKAYKIHCRDENEINADNYTYEVYNEFDLSDDELNKLKVLLASFPNSQDKSWIEKFNLINFSSFPQKLLRIAANAMDNQGYTMLGIAARAGCYPVFVQKLIDLGANLNQPDRHLYKSPIYWAISNKYSNGEEHLPENLQALKCLLENGASTDMAPYGHQTPLEYAQSRKFDAAANMIEEHMRINKSNHLRC